MEFIIEEPDKKIRQEIKANWDRLAKPLDGLGEFEGLLARIGAILGSPEIDIAKKAVIVMCADNGVVAEGISQSGQEISEKEILRSAKWRKLLAQRFFRWISV